MRSPLIHERDKEKENLKDKEKEKENPIIEKTYNMISNEAGNIFLDQPIHQTSFINQSDMVDPRASLESKELDNNREYPVREANYSLNGRDFGILGKMSPRANIEGDSESNSDKNESNIINNNTQIKDLRTQLEKRQNIQIRNDDGMVESTRPIQNEIDKIEQLAKIQESKIKDNITEEEVKKLVKLYVKSYDPKKDNEGRLISSEKFEYSNEPLISIIIPSYNKENQILKSIRSIQNQSLKNIEIIIVDDYSIDNSKDIYKYLLETDPRIRVFRHLKNMGLWRSRLDGFLYSRAKYIIHFDMGDQYINNFVLEDNYNIISKYNLDSVKFSSYTYNNKSEPFNYRHVKFNNFELKISYEKRYFDVTTYEYGTIWNRLIRANVITKGLYLLDTIIYNAYKNMWEDRWWNTLANKFSNSYVMNNRPGYLYLISFDGEGTMKKGNATMNDLCIREFILFWVFDLKLLPKEDNKESIIKILYTFNQSDNKYLGSPIHLDFISTKNPIYEYFLNSLLNDDFVSDKNKDFIRTLYNNYLNQINKL
jgi:glycosyltransferase involved in cell wall biosynthesis